MAQNPSNVIPDQLIVVEGDAGFVPKSEPSDAGKVLKVDPHGTPVWGEDSGGTSFEPDKGLQLVDGKLSVKINYDYSGITNNLNGQGIVAISRADNSLTVNNAGVRVTNPLPASTSADENKVLTVNASGVAGWQTPATVTVDQTYNASSANAQSGVAVAGAITGIRQVPVSTSAEADKVLTVNSSGTPEWAAAQGGGGSREYKPKIDDSELLPRSMVFKMHGYVVREMDFEAGYTYSFTPSTTLPLPSPFSPYAPSGHDSLFDLDTLDSSNGIYRIRWKGNGNIWSPNSPSEDFIPLKDMLSLWLCDGSENVQAVVEAYGIDLTGVTDASYFFDQVWNFGDMNLKNTSSVTNMAVFGLGTGELKERFPSAGLPLDDTYFMFPMDLSSCTDISAAFAAQGYLDNTYGLYSGNLPDLKLSGGLASATSAFSGQKNLDGGILAQYIRMAALPNLSSSSSHRYTFDDCGASKLTTGAVQLSQIPSTWGGTGT